MTRLTGFPPVEAADATVLILGSMPSAASLAAQQYYAHPRNAFWYIIECLYSDTTDLSYAQRTAILSQNRIALWDVLQSCKRQGSLDTAIDSNSIITNDFPGFFKSHRKIQAVIFNGARAEQEFRRHVLAEVDKRFPDIEYHRLPSTSPAMAILNREAKYQQWKRVLDKFTK